MKRLSAEQEQAIRNDVKAHPELWTSYAAVLDEIDALRTLLDAAHKAEDAKADLLRKLITERKKLQAVADKARELAQVPVVDFATQRCMLAEIRILLNKLDAPTCSDR